jgi:hypothetical protein
MSLYLKLGLVLAGAAIVIAIFMAGENYAARKNASEVTKYRENEIRLLGEIDKAKAKRDVIYTDRVKIIQGSNDPRGCLDAPFPDDFIAGLRGTGGKTK